MISKDELEKLRALQQIREVLLKKPLEKGWRIKKKEEVGYTRYALLILLYEKKTPLSINQLAFETGHSYSSIREHCSILADNKVICDKLIGEDASKRYFTICPVCPLINECNEPLEFWLKTSLMPKQTEPSPSPSEQFMREGERE